MFRRAARIVSATYELTVLVALTLGSTAVAAVDADPASIVEQLPATPGSAIQPVQRPADHGTLGVMLSNQADQAIVTALYIGGPAHRAGLRCGDRILAINGQPVNSRGQLMEWLDELPAGQRVDLLVDCGGWTHRFLVTLERREVVASYPVSQPPAVPAPAHGPRRFGFYGRGYISGQRALDIDDPYRRALYTNFGN